jgi:hypothetical protein
VSADAATGYRPALRDLLKARGLSVR